jgi:uncharacterized protein YggE
MKNILILAITLLIVNTAYSQSGEKNFIDQNYIEVTGKAEMEIIPDIIKIKILISEKDSKTKTPVAETEKIMMKTLKDLGIDIAKDLSLKDLTSDFKYYFLLKSDIVLTREYQLVVRDGKTAGKVFVDLEKAGISNVSIEHLDHSKIEDFRRDVKINAIKAAKEKAGFLTKAVEQTAGRAIFIQELDNRVYSNRMASNYSSSPSIHRGQSESDVDINFERLKLEYSVLVRFELK